MERKRYAACYHPNSARGNSIPDALFAVNGAHPFPLTAISEEKLGSEFPAGFRGGFQHARGAYRLLWQRPVHRALFFLIADWGYYSTPRNALQAQDVFLRHRDPLP